MRRYFIKLTLYPITTLLSIITPLLNVITSVLLAVATMIPFATLIVYGFQALNSQQLTTPRDIMVSEMNVTAVRWILLPCSGGHQRAERENLRARERALIAPVGVWMFEEKEASEGRTLTISLDKESPCFNDDLVNFFLETANGRILWRPRMFAEMFTSVV